MMRGEKIYLRPIVRRDLETLNRWKNDESVYRYLGGGFQPVSQDQQEKWMDALMDLTGGSRRFIVAEMDRTPVGMVGLYDINWVHRTCEIGAYIGEPHARGKGYASEACTLLETYAFQYLNLRKIKLKVVSGNTAACALWRKLGYREVGEYVAERYIEGHYHNVKLMEKFVGGGVTCPINRHRSPVSAA